MHFAAPTFEFRFDRAINYTTIYDLIKVTDSQGQPVTVNKRGCKFNQLSSGYGNAVFAIGGNLKVGETYNVSLSGELRDREGLPMVQNAEFSFKAVDVTEGAEARGTVIEDCDGTEPVFRCDMDNTTGVGTSTPSSIVSTTKLFGRSSAKLGYRFADNHDGRVVWAYNGSSVETFTNGDVIGVYVNGDFNNHDLYVGLISGTDVKYTKLAKIDFLGWRYCEVVLDNLEPGYPYTLAAVRLDQETSPVTMNGGICLDNFVRRSAEAGIEGIVAQSPDKGVSAYPVPATDVINVTTDSQAAVESLELLSLSGASMARVYGAASIRVAGLPSGFYFLRVALSDGSESIVRVAVR